jgi:ATP/ADP translocase
MFVMMVLRGVRLRNNWRCQLAVVAFYAFREIYVTLISTQQWSFIVSNLNGSNSSYIVTFGGVVSVASTMGGIGVEQIVKHFGVQGLLCAATILMVCVTVNAEVAYYVASLVNKETSAPNKPGIEKSCSKGQASSSSESPVRTGKENSVETIPSDRKIKSKAKLGSTWSESWKLFAGNATLRMLLGEALVHQTCANLLHIMFHDGIRNSIIDHDFRAVVVGRFFATVNFASCLLQIFVVPRILTQATLPKVLSLIPLAMLMVASMVVIFPSLIVVMIGFGTLKVLEYSVKSGAMEMIYMPLDHEVRYVGKEFVRFFGHKIGKSGASLAFSFVNAQFQPTTSMQAVYTCCAATGWIVVMYNLSAHLNMLVENKDREQKEKISLERHGKSETPPVPKRVDLKKNSVQQYDLPKFGTARDSKHDSVGLRSTEMSGACADDDSHLTEYNDADEPSNDGYMRSLATNASADDAIGVEKDGFTSSESAHDMVASSLTSRCHSPTGDVSVSASISASIQTNSRAEEQVIDGLRTDSSDYMIGESGHSDSTDSDDMHSATGSMQFNRSQYLSADADAFSDVPAPVGDSGGDSETYLAPWDPDNLIGLRRRRKEGKGTSMDETLPSRNNDMGDWVRGEQRREALSLSVAPRYLRCVHNDSPQMLRKTPRSTNASSGSGGQGAVMMPRMIRVGSMLTSASKTRLDEI